MVADQVDKSAVGKQEPEPAVKQAEIVDSEQPELRGVYKPLVLGYPFIDLWQFRHSETEKRIVRDALKLPVVGGPDM